MPKILFPFMQFLAKVPQNFFNTNISWRNISAEVFRKKSIICTSIVILLFCQNIFAQKFSKAEMTKKFGELFEIKQFPAENLVANAQSAWLCFAQNENHEISFLFLLSDSSFWLSSQITLPEDINLCENPEVRFENDSLKVECRLMRGIINGLAFQGQGFDFIFIGDYTYDLNAAVYATADAAIIENDPLKYCQAYAEAQYYMDFSYRVREAMIWADSLAFAFFEKKQFAEAAELMKKMETNCWFSIDENFAEQFPDDFQNIWKNASFYYLKAAKYEDCARICEKILAIFPTLTPTYLQYADALFLLKKDNYAFYYQKYAENMQKEGKQKKIPKRVLTRQKKKKSG